MASKSKEGKLFILASVIVLFLVVSSFASAGIFSDLKAKITGKATSDTTSVSITIGNSQPTVGYVEAIQADAPSEGNPKRFSFIFNATDTDGVGNLNDSSAQAHFTRAGEATRSNISCVNIASDSGTDTVTYNCSIDMYYFDQSGSWDINVTVADINGAWGENSTTSFTLNLLTAMVMSPNALTWPQIGLVDTDTGSDNDPILINNTGNDESLTINVTAYDLQGTTNTDEYIYANNFSIGISSEGCSGTLMDNDTSIEVNSATLEKGNNSVNSGDDSSGQEQLYACLKGVPQDITAQSYTSSAYGSWNFEIVT